jgi:peroxiredoxin
VKTFALCIWFSCVALLASAEKANSLIGTHPPELNVTNWINSSPLQLKDLEGKVALIRWWTAPACPYCKATAPALNEFHKKYSAQGLRVIGIYHHKGDDPLDVENVKRYAQNYKLNFPVAIDPDWRTLRQWWLNKVDSGWTSVTFLLDRKGVIRFIHPGGQYVKGDKEYAALKKKIDELLAEKP